MQRSSWVILHLGVSRREREDNIILQALFDGIFFVGEKKVALLFLLYIADFFLFDGKCSQHTNWFGYLYIFNPCLQ